MVQHQFIKSTDQSFNLQRAACVSTPAVLRDQRLASLYMEQDLVSDGTAISQSNMADKGTVPKAATARFKSDIWCSLVFQRVEKKQHVGQTSNLQTMKRDGEILWECNESLQPLDNKSPGRNTVDTT